MNIQNFSTFIDREVQESEVKEILNSERVRKIEIFALGPEGTNIGIASRKWVRELGLQDKAAIHYAKTPEESLELANRIRGRGIFPVFVTCAVYNRLNEIFFSHPDCYTFFHHYYMKLDQLQLAAREQKDRIPEEWVIASHPSPRVLLRNLPNTIVDAYSNAHAAMLCGMKEVDCCITTESAKNIYGLKTIFNFGQPVMCFFFGTTLHGMEILKEIQKERKG